MRTYNVCPTDPIDTIVETDGMRELVTMRWGLVPRWWSKSLKDVKMATFNARAWISRRATRSRARNADEKSDAFVADAGRCLACLVPRATRRSGAPRGLQTARGFLRRTGLSS